VSYGLLGLTDYDADQNDCMRTSEAYSVKVSRDNSWVSGGRDQAFDFQACVDTRWDQLIDEAHQGYVQLDDIALNTDMILLQAGGDNANFTAITYACIFTPEDQEWGPTYPDSKGEYYQEIEKASQYIHGKNEHELLQDTRWVVDTIFQHDKIKNNPDFRLFVPSYVHFFHEGSEGDWCGNASFALRQSDRPILSLALRKKINELVHALNGGIKAGIAGSQYAERVQFIDIDSQFADHRFCQQGHTLHDQYFGDKVYFWNISPDSIVLGGRENEAVNGAPVTSGDVQWLNMIRPFQSQAPGIALRPFHPKDRGHTVIANAIIKILKESYNTEPLTHITGVSDVATEPNWKHSIQILFREYDGYMSWFVYQGPFGIAVNPCGDNRFAMIVKNHREKRNIKNLSLMEPPYVAEGTKWNVELEGWADPGQCRYESASDDPGHLVCGDFFDYPVSKDAGYYRKNINCARGKWPDGTYHRAWVVEY
jgi:hypothetical protein